MSEDTNDAIEERAIVYALIFGSLLSVVLFCIPPFYRILDVFLNFIPQILGSVVAYVISAVFGMMYPIIVVILSYRFFGRFFRWLARPSRKDIAKFEEINKNGGGL